MLPPCRKVRKNVLTDRSRSQTKAMDIVRRPTKPRPRTAKQPRVATIPKPAPIIIQSQETSTLRDRFHRKRRRHSPLLRNIFFVILILLVASGSWLFWKVSSVSERVSLSGSRDWSLFSSIRSVGNLTKASFSSDIDALRGAKDGRINILLLGHAGEHRPGKNLTDTVMMMSIDTRNNRVGLLSLPRDLYARIPDTSTHTKINSLYQVGINEGVGSDLIRGTISNITGLPIHYSIIVDFDAFEKIIDTLGGIGIYAERDIYDTRYPGPNYSYETFELKQGWHTLDGATALKYVRERHDDPEGDFGRAKRQQQVIQAVKEQAFSLGTFTNPFTLNTLLDTLGESIQTDITAEEIPSFLTLSQKVDTQNIANAVADAWKPDSILRVSHVQVGPTAMFILVPRVGNWSEIHDLAENLFDLDILRRQNDEVASEEPSVALLNRSGHPEYTDRFSRLLREQPGFRDIRTASYDMITVVETSTVTERNSGRKLWSLNALLKRFPLTLAQSDYADTAILADSDNGPDFVITLGSDIGSLFRYDEASPEEYRKDQDSRDFGEFLPPTE